MSEYALGEEIMMLILIPFMIYCGLLFFKLLADESNRDPSEDYYYDDLPGDYFNICSTIKPKSINYTEKR